MVSIYISIYFVRSNSLQRSPRGFIFKNYDHSNITLTFLSKWYTCKGIHLIVLLHTNCIYICGYQSENAEHYLLFCNRYIVYRNKMLSSLAMLNMNGLEINAIFYWKWTKIGICQILRSNVFHSLIVEGKTDCWRSASLFATYADTKAKMRNIICYFVIAILYIEIKCYRHWQYWIWTG
jgi:hypothetical protein